MTYHPKPRGPNGVASHNGEGAAFVVGALDMNDENDRNLIRSRRWKISDGQRTRYVSALDAALGMAVRSGDHRAMNGIVRTMATLEGQNQADEHLAIRLASGAGAMDGDRIEVVYESWPALPDGEDDDDD